MYDIGDKVITKKNHPCGGNRWIIVRNGADYKLKCEKCGRIVLVTPDELKKIIKNIIRENK